MRNNRPLGQSFTPVTPMNSPTGAAWGGKEYRGKRMDLKNGDPMKDQPIRVKGNPRAKVFNMEVEDDVKEYQEVMQGVVTSRLFIAVKQLLPDGPQFRVYLEWYEDFYTDPESAKNVQ